MAMGEILVMPTPTSVGYFEVKSTCEISKILVNLPHPQLRRRGRGSGITNSICIAIAFQEVFCIFSSAYWLKDTTYNYRPYYLLRCFLGRNGIALLTRQNFYTKFGGKIYRLKFIFIEQIFIHSFDSI